MALRLWNVLAAPQWQAIAAIVVAGATIVLVCVTWQYTRLTRDMLAAQVEPQVDLDLDVGRPVLFISNRGARDVVDVSVKVETAIVLGPPMNEIVSRRGVRSAPDPTASAWWRAPKLVSGKVQDLAFEDIAMDGLKSVSRLQEAKNRGQVQGLPVGKESAAFHLIVSFRAAFYREVDRRRYTIQKSVLVVAESASGRPIVMDRLDASFLSHYRDTLRAMDEHRP